MELNKYLNDLGYKSVKQQYNFIKDLFENNNITSRYEQKKYIQLIKNDLKNNNTKLIQQLGGSDKGRGRGSRGKGSGRGSGDRGRRRGSDRGSDTTIKVPNK